MLIEAGQLKMKKYNIRGQKDMQKKKEKQKKRKMADVHCKGEKKS